MATTPMYDPLSSEARSPWLAGLTEACAKLSGILDLEVDSFRDLTLSPVDDNYIIYQAPLGNKLWMESPAPVIRKNGIVITPITANFTINYLGGSVEFDRDSGLTKSDVLTADATYVIDKSNTISSILDKLGNIELTAGQFKGYFPDVVTMESALGNGVAGNYVLIGGEENTFYIWNGETKKWEKSYRETDLSGYYTADEVDAYLDGKEDLIIPIGSADAGDYYFSGSKEWERLSARVKDVALEGLDTSDASPVEDGDSVLEGIGKLQAQIDGYVHDLFGSSAPTVNTEGQIGQDYTNTSTGIKYHLVEIRGNEYIWEQYQDKLEIDSTPTAGSSNLITSGAVYEELQAAKTDISGKADKAIPSAVGNIAILGEDGNLVDSGKGVEDVGRSPTIDTVTLSTGGWSGASAPYTQVATVYGVVADTAKQIIHISPVPSASNVETVALNNVYCTSQGSDTLTFTAQDSKPTSAVSFNIAIQDL